MNNTIVVAFDFSTGSMQALEYAIMIGNRISSDICMVYVSKPDNLESLFPDPANDPRNEAKKRFEGVITQFKESVKGKISYKIRTGKVYKEVVNLANSIDALMIVAGSHGISGFEEFWIGSNATKIVTYADCPVITVRHGVDPHKVISKIVFPIDSTRQTRQKAPFTSILAVAFHAEIHILKLYSSKIKSIRNLVDGYANQVIKLLQSKNIRYKIAEMDASNLTSVAIEYAKDVEADLITIMTEQETSASNILLGTFAQQMINNSPVPVLTIRARSFYDYQTKDV
jgi:nucleotide-binding universal stress UspA family protein